MPERWLREIQRLADEHPPDELGDRIQQRAGEVGSGHPLRPRLLAAAIAFLILAGASYGVARAFLPNRTPGPIASIISRPPASRQPAAVALVICDESGTTVSTPVVRNRPDGVHVSAVVGGKVNIVGVEVPGGGGLFYGVNSGHVDMVLTAAPPGTYRVVCLNSRRASTTGFPPKSSRDATFVVVGAGPTLAPPSIAASSQAPSPAIRARHWPAHFRGGSCSRCGRSTTPIAT
jgi:hypothetical protein